MREGVQTRSTRIRNRAGYTETRSDDIKHIISLFRFCCGSQLPRRQKNDITDQTNEEMFGPNLVLASKSPLSCCSLWSLRFFNSGPRHYGAFICCRARGGHLHLHHIQAFENRVIGSGLLFKHLRLAAFIRCRPFLVTVLFWQVNIRV